MKAAAILTVVLAVHKEEDSEVYVITTTTSGHVDWKEDYSCETSNRRSLAGVNGW